MARIPALIICAAVLAIVGQARADLGNDVEALSIAWHREGQVTRLPTQLHERGNDRYLVLPPGTLSSKQNPCTTVVVLGVPASSFVVRFVGTQREAKLPSSLRSRAGIVEVTRCERGRKALREVVVELRSPRAVLETLVLVSPGPPGEAVRVLPERIPGPTAAAADPGPAPAPGDIVERAKKMVSLLTQRGAAEVDHGLLRSDVDGAGLTSIELAPGCHELTVMGISAPAGAPHGVDVDVDLAWPNGELAASDRTEAPDAAVQLCVAQERNLALRFAGALPGSPVLFVHARWSLPPGLDSRWPPEVQAGLAQVLREHRLRIPARGLVTQSLGVAGVTAIPVELEPDACYVVAVTVHRGSADGVAAAVAVGSRRSQNHGGPNGQGTALAFCARGENSALVEVDALGVTGLAWHLAVWQSGRLRPGEVAL